MDEVVSSPELMKLSGASYRQVHHWTVTGLLRTMPWSPPAPGSGKRVHYPASEVAVATMLRQISLLGMLWAGPEFVPELVKRVRRHGLKGDHTFGALTFHLDKWNGQ